MGPLDGLYFYQELVVFGPTLFMPAEFVKVIKVFNELVCKSLKYEFKKNERCFSMKTKLNIWTNILNRATIKN